MLRKEELRDILLNQIIKNFFIGNLNFCLESEDIENMDWEWQQTFVDSTINSKLLKKYPICVQFARLFLKKLIQYLEPYQEVHDDLYAHLCTAMYEPRQDGFSYRHYIIGNNLSNIITIKETRNMVVNGTTGLKTWEAALMLSDWALDNSSIFSRKKVLELGSGVGFTGITIGKLCDIKSLMFTDCHNDVLRTICENIHINFSNFQRDQVAGITMFQDEHKSLGVMMLDWNSFDDIPADILPDIVIGADIVYDPTILQPLCNVIKSLCARNKQLEVYIASVVRNEETFSEFLKTLGENKLEHEEIELSKGQFIEWDTNIHKCFLKIKAKLQ